MTVSASNYTGRVKLGVLAANKMTVTQKGYLAGIELFSDASVNQLKNFTSESLRIVSPANKVVISNSSWQEKASINIGYANTFTLTDTSVSCARKKRDPNNGNFPGSDCSLKMANIQTVVVHL